MQMGKAERLIVEWCGDSGVIFIEFGAGPRSGVGIQGVTTLLAPLSDSTECH